MKYTAFSKHILVVMAESEASHKQKTKRRKHSQNNRKKAKKTRAVIQPRLPKTASEVSSNWKALAAVIQSKREESKSLKRKRSPSQSGKLTDYKSNRRQREFVKEKRSDIKSEKDEIWFDDVDPDVIERVRDAKQRKLSENDHVHTPTHHEMKENEVQEQEPSITKHVAMDCEFVGVGKEGSEHMLARVSIVNSGCEVLYDKYVAAQEKVVDYRTDVSGIRPFHLRNAPKFTDVQKDIAALIKDKILIGHSISTDLKVLLLDHPRKRIRDTAKYKPFQEKVKTKRPSLKKLAKEVLSLSIQSGEHSSVEDARAAMKLYVTHRKEWEKSLKDKFRKTKKSTVTKAVDVKVE